MEINIEKINRIEVINHASNNHPIGRLLTLYKEMNDFDNVEIDIQDGGRTMKIFLQSNAKEENDTTNNYKRAFKQRRG